MTYRARLRLELPDRPGALGHVAGVLGKVGGNVVSIDVQDGGAGLAVDEMVVDLPDEVNAEDLRRALEAAKAGTLLTLRAARPYSDNVLRALQWAEALIETPPSQRDDALASALADLCSASGAWVTTSTAEARRFEAGRYALERGSPVAHRTAVVPLSMAPAVNAEGWLLAVPDDPAAPGRVAFLVRPLQLRFTNSEIARASALLRACRLLERLAPGVAHLVS